MTLVSVLNQKFAAFVEERTVLELLTIFGLCLLAGIASSAVLNLDGTLRFLGSVVRWKNFALPTIGSVFYLVFNAKRLSHWFVRQLVKTVEFYSGVDPEETIEGIPVSELLDHLFREKSFLRDDIESKFGIPRHRHTALAKSLEDLEVLKRGENNSRVLNEEFSRQDVALILRGKLKAADLRPLFRKKGESFTSTPSASEIEARVNSLLSIGFQKREIPENGLSPMRNRCATHVQPGVQPLPTL